MWRPSIPRDRLAIAVISGLVVVLAVGLIAGGALVVTRRGSSSATIRLSPDDISEILESKKRTHRIVTAPGKGLSLDRVFYK